MRTTRSGLDPVRTLRLPRRGTILRTALAGVLLLAAAVAWSGAGGSDHPPAAPAAPGAAGTAPPPHTPGNGPSPPGLSAPPEGAQGARLPVPSGLVGVPVPLASPTTTAILRPGDRVDLLATGVGGDPRPVMLAEDAPVLAVDHPGVAVLLGLSPPQAREVIAATATATFAVTLRS